jgi:hypothetical protein
MSSETVLRRTYRVWYYEYVKRGGIINQLINEMYEIWDSLGSDYEEATILGG